MRKIVSAVLLLALAYVGSAFGATQYVSSPPLTKVVNVEVGPVRAGGITQVPIITWGGDIATIYANGNSRSTARGSVFDREGLRLNLVHEDVFPKQVEDYMSGKTPYLRGTIGQINMAAEILKRDPRTEPVFIYQLTESAGGDMVVVKPGIKTAKDLCGKTIVLQAYGPHVDYMTKIVTDACGSVDKVRIKWTKDITAPANGAENSPAAAFREDKSVDAAFVIAPDGMALTSNGTVGSGAEGSVKGARVLMSTKTANRVIADVYAVRADYFKSNRADVEKFVHGLFVGEEQLRALFKNRSAKAADYKQMLTASAEILLDSPKATADVEGLYDGAEFSGFRGNVAFFGNPSYPRNFEKRTDEIQSAFMMMGLSGQKVAMSHAKWDYSRLKAGLTDIAGVEAPRFDSAEVAKVIDRQQKQGTLGQGELFSFEVFFQPNQNTFTKDLYGKDFSRVVEYASTYGGAVITIEGHSDPLGYLKAKKESQPEDVLRRIMQSAKNLSLARANAVRDSIIGYAKSKGITLDASQFVVVGHGIEKPKTGKCGNDPCAPKTESEWRSNMRVEFRVIQIEAESSAFKPL
ncbi:MAG: ABC-type nitrate/sulfonate/bicarbonate transport system, periplasmic component [Parcubacteria group bacterium GW2011_GWA2_47_10]|nr:MAG: ABC-type nitrate/sulfonate/bicarbonate transport system, periplasmic component [Parcubacteria group bacterium GW2011_GWA2_47_10]